MNIFIGLGAVLLLWVVVGTVKKLHYFAGVEKRLREKSVNPQIIQNEVGKQRYINAMSFCKQQKVTPSACADLLKMYVYDGVAKHIGTPDRFEERRLLYLLGYLQEWKS